MTERKNIEEELQIAKARLTEEKLHLEHAIDDRSGFGEIIGWETGLKSVIEGLKSVARTDATVLCSLRREQEGIDCTGLSPSRVVALTSPS